MGFQFEVMFIGSIMGDVTCVGTLCMCGAYDLLHTSLHLLWF